MPEKTSQRHESVHLMLLLISQAVLSLYLLRFFLIESVVDGETLWLVGLWLVALLAWGFFLWPTSNVVIGWPDLCVVLLAGSHVVSALVVIGTRGDKRAALNLMWEWIGVGVAWFLLRQLCRQLDFRRQLVVATVAAGAVVAGTGLYQHYYALPRMVAKYGPLYDRLKTADAGEAAAIRKILMADNVPVEGPGLVLFEKRLRDSREPMGFFGMANTLGGFLTVCVVLTVALLVSSRRARAPGLSTWWWVWLPVLAVLIWCLLLTKSRTAWIGTAVGLASFAMGVQLKNVSRKQIRVAVVGLVLAAAAGWGLVRFGGLDRQVLTEAPKSLQYRLQYWQATWSLIKAHPWLGVGPGQFRPHYLLYKLPQASEEIVDPHNLFLDVAANGGLIAITALLAFGVLLVTSLRSPKVSDYDDNSSGGTLDVYLLGGFIGFACLWFALRAEDDRLLAALTVVLIWSHRRWMGLASIDWPLLRLGTGSAAIALMVHLLGAGGIGMPPISILLLALVAVAEADCVAPASSRTTRGWLRWATPVLTLGMLTALYITGVQPVSEAQQRIEAGDNDIRRSEPDRADREYAAAAVADPLSPEPWRRRAELAYRTVDAGRFQSNELFQDAVRFLHEASLRTPLNFQEERRLGGWWLARWRVTHESADAEQAAAALQRAFDRYPTNAILMSELVSALQAAGEFSKAAEIAERALKQDSINRDWGHVDRLLSPVVRNQMERIAGKEKPE